MIATVGSLAPSSTDLLTKSLVYLRWNINCHTCTNIWQSHLNLYLNNNCKYIFQLVDTTSDTGTNIYPLTHTHTLTHTSWLSPILEWGSTHLKSTQAMFLTCVHFFFKIVLSYYVSFIECFGVSTSGDIREPCNSIGQNLAGFIIPRVLTSRIE